mgnify:FL=1
MLPDTGWLFVQVAFPILLIVLGIYVALRRRRLTPREKAAQHEAIQELYEDTPGDRAARDAAERDREATTQAAPRRASRG